MRAVEGTSPWVLLAGMTCAAACMSEEQLLMRAHLTGALMVRAMCGWRVCQRVIVCDGNATRHMPRNVHCEPLACAYVDARTQPIHGFAYKQRCLTLGIAACRSITGCAVAHTIRPAALVEAGVSTAAEAVTGGFGIAAPESSASPAVTIRPAALVEAGVSAATEAVTRCC